jgi:SSS family solute:Na+ symporter
MLLDVSVVVLYSAAMLFVGWRSRRQSGESYWVAERQYGISRISASLIVTVFGASATMGVIGLGYSRGLTGAWWPLTGALALIPFGLFFADRIRGLTVYTLPDVLKGAYGDRVAVPAAAMISISWCGVIAAQMIAGARLLDGVFAIGYTAALAVIAVVFVVYTFWGGQLSVVRTDTWQLGLFLVGLLVCLTLVTAASSGTNTVVAEPLPRGHMNFPVSSGFGWYDLLVYYPLIVGLPFLVGPDLWSRVFCAKDGVVARRSVLLAASAIVPIALLLAGLGILIRARFPGLAPDGALPEAIRQLLPIGVRGVVVAAFLAAIMSSADTTLVTASTILSLNVLAPFGFSSEGKQLIHTRVCLIIVGIVAWAVAGFQQGIIPALLLGYTIYVGGVVVPTLASFFRKRLGITTAGAMWAVIIGGSTAILGEIRQGGLMRSLVGADGDSMLRTLLGSRYPSILPLVLSVLVLFLVSKITSGHARGDGHHDGR